MMTVDKTPTPPPVVPSSHPPPDCLSAITIPPGSIGQRAPVIHTVCWERPTSLAKLSSPSERVLILLVLTEGSGAVL